MFKEIDKKELMVNSLTCFGDDWMALTAGTKETGCNTMTVAWGHMGSLWSRSGQPGYLPTAVCYVRPQRYTKEFMDREPFFTLSAFSAEYKKALGYLGSHSGRDSDKIAEAGLTPVYSDGTAYFAEAEKVYICRKLYHGALSEDGFIDKALVEHNYPERDFHEVYIGEIVKILMKA